jgi:hypothetical protein
MEHNEMSSDNQAITNWQRRMAAVVDPSALDPEEGQFLIETSQSVVQRRSLPAIDGYPACEVDKAILLETLAFSLRLACSIPEPIDASISPER